MRVLTLKEEEQSFSALFTSLFSSNVSTDPTSRGVSLRFIDDSVDDEGLTSDGYRYVTSIRDTITRPQTNRHRDVGGVWISFEKKNNFFFKSTFYFVTLENVE